MYSVYYTLVVSPHLEYWLRVKAAGLVEAMTVLSVAGEGTVSLAFREGGAG